MKISIKEVVGVLLVIAVLFVGMLSVASDGWAQEKGSTLAQQIQGSWILVSLYNEKDGKKIEPFGPNPRGSLILTPDGRFSNDPDAGQPSEVCCQQPHEGYRRGESGRCPRVSRHLWQLCGKR